MKDFKVLPSLVERAKAGDEEAFVEIYNFFSKHVYYNAFKLVGNESDAKDVLQEVMLRIYRRLGDIQDPKSLPLYIYRTTHNLCIQTLQARQNSSLAEKEEDTYLTYGEEKRLEFLPAQYAEAQEQKDYLLGLVDGLHPNYKAVLTLFYYNGLSLKEIAQVLEISTNTARVRLQRGRGALKQTIEGDAQKRGALLSAMSVPVLTRVMQDDANQLFTAEVNSQVWQEIAGKLGLSTATAVAASAAVSATSAGVATGAAMTAGVGVKIMAGILTAGAVSGALWGTGLLGPDRKPAGQESSPANTDIASGASPGEDINTLEVPYQNGSGMTGNDLNPDAPGVPHTSRETAEAPASAEASGAEAGNRGFGKAPVESETGVLRYPKGTELSLEKIYQDAGITGAPVKDAAIFGLEEIDVNRPNEYGVIITFPGGTSYDEYGIAIVIIIES